TQRVTAVAARPGSVVTVSTASRSAPSGIVGGRDDDDLAAPVAALDRAVRVSGAGQRVLPRDRDAQRAPGDEVDELLQAAGAPVGAQLADAEAVGQLEVDERPDALGVLDQLQRRVQRVAADGV